MFNLYYYQPGVYSYKCNVMYKLCVLCVDWLKVIDKKFSDNCGANSKTNELY